MINEYECALSGVTSPGAQVDESDGMEDCPVGWTKVRFTRRQYNPTWIMLQQLKATTVDNLVRQHSGGHPENATPEQRMVVTLQVEANYHALEKDTPMYFLDVDDVVFLSDSGEVAKSINEIREMLGLEPIEEPEEQEEEEETGLTAG
jgi:hypothetical protein